MAAFAIVGEDMSSANLPTVDEILAGDEAKARIGALFSLAAGWHEEDLSIRTRSHELLMREAGSVSGFEAHAVSTAADGRQRLAADDSTREFLTALTQNENLLRETTGHFFVQSLQGLLLYPGFEELVLTVAERTADLALGSTDRSGGLYDGELVGLAVTLQRAPTGIRARAMTLYERLLDNAVYGAEEAATSALRR